MVQYFKGVFKEIVEKTSPIYTYNQEKNLERIVLTFPEGARIDIRSTSEKVGLVLFKSGELCDVLPEHRATALEYINTINSYSSTVGIFLSEDNKLHARSHLLLVNLEHSEGDAGFVIVSAFTIFLGSVDDAVNDFIERSGA